MSGLFDLIERQVNGSAVQEISREVGIDPSVAQRAVTVALPLILGGMSAHAASPANARTIQAEAAYSN